MSYINFDYFVERGVLLTEMSRPVSVFKTRELLPPYDRLRKFYSSNIKNKENPGTLQNYVFRYMRDNIEGMVTPEESDEWNPRASAPTVKEVAIRHIENVMQRAREESPEKYNEILQTYINSISDLEDFKEYVIEAKANPGKRRIGALKKEEELTSLDPAYLTELGLKLKPYIDKMNKLMFPRIIARSKGSEISTVKDPDILKTEIILELFTQMQGKKSLMYKESVDNVDYDKSDAPKKWISRSKIATDTSPTPKTLNQYLALVSTKEFEDSIGTLITLIKNKLEKGSPQSLEGVIDIFNLIKKHKNVSENLVGLLNKTEEVLRENLSSMTNKYFGYDTDIYEQVLDNEELRHDFELYKTATDKIKENKANELDLRYRTKMSEILNKLEGKSDLYDKPDSKYTNTKQKNPDRNPYTDELETANILVKIARKNLMKLQTTTLVDPEKVKQASENIKTEIEKVKEIQAKYDQWEADRKGGDSQDSPIGEGVMLYMTEQFKKDIKFGKQHGQFVDRGYKKVTNYGQWMMLND